MTGDDRPPKFDTVDRILSWTGVPAVLGWLAFAGFIAMPVGMG